MQKQAAVVEKASIFRKLIKNRLAYNAPSLWNCNFIQFIQFIKSLDKL
jgi:hypothetical protein